MIDMPARTDRSGTVRPAVSDPRLPGRLRMRRELVVPPMKDVVRD